MSRRIKPSDHGRILDHLARKVLLRDDADLVADVKRYCRKRRIVATDDELQSMATKAFQLRMSKRIKRLNDRIDALHPVP